MKSETAAPDRTVLPVQEPKRPVYKELDARNAKMPPNFEVKAPAGAPNIIIFLIDDLGFGATAAYGGPIPTPTLQRLAQEGLRYNNFHTTALCSPTRAALKSGRNHHTVNMGFITEMGTGFPGATGQIPNATAPVAATLRLNGYSTAAFGKWHETLPIRVELAALGVEDFVRILTEPSASLTEQYAALLATEGVTLAFTADGVRRIAEVAFQVNERTENIGARRLHTVMERLLQTVSYEAADRGGETVNVDAAYVERHVAPLASDEDLARYIL